MARQLNKRGKVSECHEKGHKDEIPSILWTEGSNKTPLVKFMAEAVIGVSPLREVGKRYKLTYKMSRYGSRLVRNMLSAHGFEEAKTSSSDFQLMWTGPGIQYPSYANLSKGQKINHFPRSSELSRKDFLCKNIQRLQRKDGEQQCNFLPQSYVLPEEYQDFSQVIAKDQGPWIVKPVASCQGHGIRLINAISQISAKERLLVSRYISNPLLIKGYKFDLRLYVLVTSYDPLIIYFYEEGLARFATSKYRPAEHAMKNKFMHLTNYSINKDSPCFVANDDPEKENYGSQWTMSAMLRHLKQKGKDTTTLMAEIEDLIIKTIISVEGSITVECSGVLAGKKNCFELYGFDVLIDENLKPWLMEVNSSPSLDPYSPLGLKVKANLIADMLTLVGLECKDLKPEKKGGPATTEKNIKAGYCMTSALQTKPSLYDEWMAIVQDIREEEKRQGGFVRLFPRQDTWKQYGSLLTYKSLNHMLAQHLFTETSTEPENGIKQRIALYERMLPPVHRPRPQYQFKQKPVKPADTTKACQQSRGKDNKDSGRMNLPKISDLCSRSSNTKAGDLRSKRPAPPIPKVVESRNDSSGGAKMPAIVRDAKTKALYNNDARVVRRFSQVSGDLQSRKPLPPMPKVVQPLHDSPLVTKLPTISGKIKPEALHYEDRIASKRFNQASKIIAGFSDIYKLASDEQKWLQRTLENQKVLPGT
ncbi:tubulin polyglutamylase TTLL5 isoform X4 [Pelobates cultripes]|uniref:Tubulin--tyrosine ligase-like protein 5 n=1 Tax=Pelobates cultripes TaxID=61616 RepID=A0AAD1WYB8_PELCU|nr:tubulin polyglutamylase TTLL5 isoform X4 [Pelobates cultripes]